MQNDLLQLLVNQLNMNELKELRTAVNSRLIDLISADDEDKVRYARITTVRYISLDGTEERAKSFLTALTQEEKERNDEITENTFCFIDKDFIPDNAVVTDFRTDKGE